MMYENLKVGDLFRLKKKGTVWKIRRPVRMNGTVCLESVDLSIYPKQYRIIYIHHLKQHYTPHIRPLGPYFEPRKRIIPATQIIIFEVRYGRIWKHQPSCRIEMPVTCSFHDLANVILDWMNFDDDHLYSFHLDEIAYSKNTDLTYTSPMSNPDQYREMKQAIEHRFIDLGLVKKQRILFVYDFGDDYRFGVKVIGYDKKDINTYYPRIRKRKNDKHIPDQYPFLEP